MLAQLSYLRKEDKIKDAPTWFKQNDAPEWFDKVSIISPLVYFTRGLCILIASVSSWYTIDQTYMGWQPSADDNLGNTSTHEISWGLSHGLFHTQTIQYLKMDESMQPYQVPPIVMMNNLSPIPALLY